MILGYNPYDVLGARLWRSEVTFAIRVESSEIEKAKAAIERRLRSLAQREGIPLSTEQRFVVNGNAETIAVRIRKAA